MRLRIYSASIGIHNNRPAESRLSPLNILYPFKSSNSLRTFNYTIFCDKVEESIRLFITINIEHKWMHKNTFCLIVYFILNTKCGLLCVFVFRTQPYCTVNIAQNLKKCRSVQREILLFHQKYSCKINEAYPYYYLTVLLCLFYAVVILLNGVHLMDRAIRKHSFQNHLNFVRINFFLLQSDNFTFRPLE